MKCICERCGKNYIYIRGKGITTKYCASCMVNRRRFKLKQRIVAYLGGCCVECGYNKSVNALQVHHVDPSTKSFTVSGAHCRRWTIIEAELDKCELLCANCHAEVEYGIVPVSGDIGAVL